MCREEHSPQERDIIIATLLFTYYCVIEKPIHLKAVIA